jgi:cyanophycinase
VTAKRALWLATGLLLAGLPAGAEQRLVLIGGGPRPSRALSTFVDWAGGPRARVLVVNWAANDPKEALAAFRRDLEPYRPAAVRAVPRAPLDALAKARLREQLAWATAVYFTGGDQDRIMDVLRDRSLMEQVRARYDEGVVFAGTSAGTAVMSAIAITGDGDRTVIDGDEVETREGLGLLPGVILDQHFIRRQRQNRLFGLVLKHPDLLGLGVDEGTALLVRGNREVQVVGASRVVVVQAEPDGDGMKLALLAPGDTFDLKAKKRLSRLAVRDTDDPCSSPRLAAQGAPCGPALGARR